jgi:hypothetical protein
MTPSLALFADGKKFMWDGRVYATREEAARAAEAYQQERFEVRTVEHGDGYLVYTRRVAAEVVVAGP